MKDKLAKGVIWLTGAKVLVNLMSLCSTLVLARLLTPEDFGLFLIASLVITVLASVTEMSLGSALVHHKEPTDEHFNTAWTMNMLRAGLLGGALAASAPFVARFYDDLRLTPVLVMLAVSIFIGGLYNPKMVVLTRRLEFWHSFAVAVSQKLVGLVVGLGLAIAFRSYWALVGGTMATQMTFVLVSYIAVPHRPRFSLTRVRELWSFSMWLNLGHIVNMLNGKLDQFLISSFLGAKVLGTYSVGENLAALPTRECIGPLEQTLFPGLRHVVDDQERLRRTYSRAQGLISMIALPVGFGCGAIAEPLVHLVLGEKWTGAVLVVQVLACVFAFNTLSSAVHPLAMAKGNTRMMFGRDLFSFALGVPITLIGMWWAGLTGIIFSRVVSGVLGVLINAHVVRALIALPVLTQLRNSWRSLLGVALMWPGLTVAQYLWPVVGSSLQRSLWLLALLAVGGSFYLTVHFLLWFVSGKPEGAERDFIEFARNAAAKVKNLLRTK